MPGSDPRPAPAPPFSPSEVLRLRAWALRVLPAGAPAAGWADAPAASAHAWRLFLMSEGCALPLRVRLGAPPPGALSPGAETVAETLAMAEQQQFLAAGAHARRLGRWAAEAGVPLAVVKGGLAAVRGEPMVGMADLDVLAPADAVPALTAHLVERGAYRADPLAAHRNAGGHHGAPLHAGDAFPVEVHHELKGVGAPGPLLDRSLPVPGRPGLRQLDAADHLFYQLLHSTVQHPERCGGVRDLVLLAHGWAAASGEARDQVRARVAAHRRGAELGGVLQMVGRVAEGGPVADRFAAQAVARYLLVDTLLRWRPPPALQRVGVLAAFTPRGEYRRFLADELRGPLPWDLGPWARSPVAAPLVRSAGWTLRALRLALVTALAAGFGVRVRRALRHAGEPPGAIPSP